MSKKKKTSPLLTAAGLAATAAAAAAGGWIAYSNLAVDHALPLPNALDAATEGFLSPDAGVVSYYVEKKAAGVPLVLIHSVNAAASAFEMAPLFEHYRSLRPVYAVDLPGYGLSERTARVYSPGLFAGALQEFLETIVQQPADVVALSLSGEFAARVAGDQPGLIRSLTLISPTGFDQRELKSPADSHSPESGSYQAEGLSMKLVKRPFFDLIATKASIGYFLSKSFVSDVPPELVHYAYLTAHQPGAPYAPLAFLSGKLFTPDAAGRLYAQVQQPALVIYDQDPYTSFETLPAFLQSQANWQPAQIAPTRGMAHWEAYGRVITTLDRFWS